MSTIDPNITLADLVTARPEVAADLDRLGLDFCCGGSRPLQAAVAEVGLDFDEVVAVVEATPVVESDPAWDDLTGLVDHLEATHHAYLKDAMPRLTALADKVAGVHGANHSELIKVAALVGEIRADLDPHLLKEEQVLFPMIRELDEATTAPSFHCGSLVSPIGVMLAEHDMVGALLAQLRAETDGYRVPDDGCASYQLLYQSLAELETDTHVHIHKENNLLFPAVLEAEQVMTAPAR